MKNLITKFYTISPLRAFNLKFLFPLFSCILIYYITSLNYDFIFNLLLLPLKPVNSFNYSLFQNRPFTSNSYNKSEVEGFLNPNFVTGLIDGEGNFHVSVKSSPKYKLKWRVTNSFNIGFHSSELPLLLSIQQFFKGVGYITKNSRDHPISYTITKNEDLVNIVIPHFNAYPLITKKYLDFLLWSKIVNITQMGGHLTKEGFYEILSLKASINRGLPSKIINAFPEIRPNVPPEMIPITKIDPQWLIGFISGEGSFSASPYNIKLRAFRARFMITQHSRDLILLEFIKNYFGVGSIYKNGSSFNYCIESYKDCFNILLPFFTQYPIPTVCIKATNYLIWKEIIEIMQAGDHLTPDGQIRINELLSKSDMTFSLYVGSSHNLSKIFKSNFKSAYLVIDTENPIYRAIIKYGHNHFSRYFLRYLKILNQFLNSLT